MKGLLLIVNLYTVAGSIRVRLLLVGDGRKGKSQFHSPPIFRAALTPNSFRRVVLWTVARGKFWQLRILLSFISWSYQKSQMDRSGQNLEIFPS